MTAVSPASGKFLLLPLVAGEAQTGCCLIPVVHSQDEYGEDLGGGGGGGSSKCCGPDYEVETETVIQWAFVILYPWNSVD